MSLLEDNRRWYESAGGGEGALLNSCLLHAATDDVAPLEEVLEQSRVEQNNEVGVLALDALARLAAQRGEVDEAQQLLGEADALAPTVVHILDDSDRLDRAIALTLLH